MGGRSEERKRKEREEEDEIYCGMGQCRPSFMQRCANISSITAALCFAGLSTSTLSIYINSQITTLERQFGFSSSVSGILLSCNDFGYMLTTLLMSYLARRLHIPRALSLSTLLFGLSGLLCTVPFFASLDDFSRAPGSSLGPYNVTSGAGNATSGVGDTISGFGDATSGGGLTSGFGSVTSGGLSSGVDIMPGRNVSLAMTSFGLLEKYLCSRYVSLDEMFGANSSSQGVDDRCSSEGRRGPSAMSEDKKWVAVGFIAIGMVLQGFGKSPRHPFVSTYIDDNVPKTKTTLYLGIISCVSMFGPVLAFTLGGLFSRMYLTLEDTNMSPMDPRWVGAWWMGFLAFGSLGILASIPTLFFPRRLRPQPNLKRLEEERRRAAKGGKYKHDVKAFLHSVLRVLKSPVYVCILLAVCSSLFGVSGMISFLPKYLETQFMIPAWKANIILGVLNIMAASGGTLLGGFLTSRFKLSPLNCLRIVSLSSAVSVIFVILGFFLGCDQPVISMGASARATSLDAMNSNVSMTCHSLCHCDDTQFFPTCGADDVTYFSPCHAGCSESQGMNFLSCSCINATLTSSLSEMTSSSKGDKPTLVEARPGFCDPDCGMLYPYAIMNFLGAFSATFVIMPSFQASVRSVSDVDKPMSIGLSAFFSTALGWFLGPMVFGKIVDSCCMLWSSGCDGSGSCSLYDIVAFRTRYHAAFTATRLMCCMFYLLALTIAIVKKTPFAPHDDDHDVIQPTLPEEAEKPMLENGGNDDKAPPGDKQENFRLMDRERNRTEKNNAI